MKRIPKLHRSNMFVVHSRKLSKGRRCDMWRKLLEEVFSRLPKNASLSVVCVSIDHSANCKLISVCEHTNQRKWC